MKGILFDASQHPDHEDVLKLIATDIFDKIVKECKRAARYGRKGIVSFDVSKLKLYEWIPKGCEDRVLSHLHAMLLREGILKSSHGTTVDVGWIPGPTEARVPRITSRDLIELGITDTNLYGEILKQLKTAIATGEISVDTLQAQLIWVRDRFQRRKR